MAYDGWLSLGGVEVLNKARTQVYMADAAPGVLRRCDCDCGDLHEVVGDRPYRNVALDPAPWYDPDVNWSTEFFGLFPLSITGLEDSPREARLDESIRAGGFITSRRLNTREVRVRGILLGSTDRGVEYGQDWLSSVLDGSCASCHGDSLCFFSACPDVCAVPLPLVTSEVSLEHMGTDGGNWDGVRWTPVRAQSVLWTPRLKMPLPCRVTYEWRVRGPQGRAIWLHAGGEADSAQGLEPFVLNGDVQVFTVEDRGVSQNWAASRMLVTDQRNPGSTASSAVPWVDVLGVRVKHTLPRPDPYAAGGTYLRQLREVVAIEGPRRVSEQHGVNFAMREVDFTLAAARPYVYGQEVPVASLHTAPYHVGMTGTIATSSVGVPDCEEVTVPSPVGPYGILDPDAPRTPPPPLLQPLTRRPGRVTPDDHYIITIPDEALPTWTDMVPVLRLATADMAARNVRVRFFPETMRGMTHLDINGCDACGSLVIDYIPANSEFTLDGMTERASVRFNGTNEEHPANHLLSSDGEGVFTWPVLSCGVGYFAVLDVDSITLPVISLSLVARRS